MRWTHILSLCKLNCVPIYSIETKAKHSKERTSFSNLFTLIFPIHTFYTPCKPNTYSESSRNLSFSQTQLHPSIYSIETMAMQLSKRISASNLTFFILVSIFHIFNKSSCYPAISAKILAINRQSLHFRNAHFV